MPYATQQDIIDRRGNALLLVIADRDGDGVIDADAVDRALADAANLTDAHVGQKYALPLATVPALLIDINVDIAIYKLADTADVMTDQHRARYDDAMKLLGKISTGMLSLGIDPEPVTKGHGVTLAGPERLFGRDKVRNW